MDKQIGLVSARQILRAGEPAPAAEPVCGRAHAGGAAAGPAAGQGAGCKGGRPDGRRHAAADPGCRRHAAVGPEADRRRTPDARGWRRRGCPGAAPQARAGGG
ncbi:hypothetical protein G6F56_013980 [Rhizopus delemar]|nr:hypothetical protein G6F56_013980 [Rhizopus delemar]